MTSQKYYRRNVTVSIPSDIAAEKHAEIFAKAAELNARFAADAGGGKDGCLESACAVVSRSGYGACLRAGVVLVKR